jgi:hypothetical protein
MREDRLWNCRVGRDGIENDGRRLEQNRNQQSGPESAEPGRTKKCEHDGDRHIDAGF